MVEIQPVSGRSALRAFIGLPYALYRGHPHWVPPLRLAERERFRPASNPFYDHAEMRLFLARQNGALVGRIAAIDDRLHHGLHRDGTAFFGFFEATSALGHRPPAPVTVIPAAFRSIEMSPALS